jgi:hypothetical protein
LLTASIFTHPKSKILENRTQNPIRKLIREIC